MKKRKEEILCDKEQSTVQSTVQSTGQSTEQSRKQSTEQPSVRSTVPSNDTYVYGVGMLAVLAISVCVFFAYSPSQAKKIIIEKQDEPPKRHHMLKKYIQ